jgi:hypothetical protein
MKNRLNAAIFLLVLIPYILVFSKTDFNRLLNLQKNITSTGSKQFIIIADETPAKVFTQPSGLTEPILPIQFLSVNIQKKIGQNHVQGEHDYSRNNDLFLNHPIPQYKISLSVHTADG